MDRSEEAVDDVLEQVRQSIAQARDALDELIEQLD